MYLISKTTGQDLLRSILFVGKTVVQLLYAAAISSQIDTLCFIFLCHMPSETFQAVLLLKYLKSSLRLCLLYSTSKPEEWLLGKIPA